MRKSQIVILFSTFFLLATAWAGDFERALKAFESADYDTAISIWQPLADAGDARSQFQLGYMYANGFGVMLDDTQALKWYQ